jgi:hypothetical protein
MHSLVYFGIFCVFHKQLGGIWYETIYLLSTGKAQDTDNEL